MRVGAGGCLCAVGLSVTTVFALLGMDVANSYVIQLEVFVSEHQMVDAKEILPALFELKPVVRNQEYIQSMCKNLLNTSCALTLIRTFSCKQQKPAKAGGSENGVYYQHAGCSVEPR